jgi:hypothetical protein
MDGSTALTIYREEKARALQERRISHAQLMTEAKEAFAKMLADAQLARKGGRPKNNPGAPSAGSAAAAKPKVVVAAPAPPEKKPVVAAKPATVSAKPPAAKAVPVKLAKPIKVIAAPAKKVTAVKKAAKPVKAVSAAHKPAKKKVATAHHAPVRAAKPAAKGKAKKK